jgi:hypothetical protein
VKRAPKPEWYLSIDGCTMGPLSVEEVLVLWDAGRLTLESRLWRRGFSEWRHLGAIPQIADLTELVSDADLVDNDIAEVKANPLATAALIASLAEEEERIGRAKSDQILESENVP